MIPSNNPHRIIVPSDVTVLDNKYNDLLHTFVATEIIVERDLNGKMNVILSNIEKEFSYRKYKLYKYKLYADDSVFTLQDPDGFFYVYGKNSVIISDGIHSREENPKDQKSITICENSTIIRNNGASKDYIDIFSDGTNCRIVNNADTPFTIEFHNRYGLKPSIENINGIPTIKFSDGTSAELIGKIDEKTKICYNDNDNDNDNDLYPRAIKLRDIPGYDEVFGVNNDSITIKQNPDNPNEYFKCYTKIAKQGNGGEVFYGDDGEEIALSSGNEITIYEINNQQWLGDINLITPTANAVIQNPFTTFKVNDKEIADIESKGKSTITKNNQIITIEVEDGATIKTKSSRDNIAIKAHKGNNDITVDGDQFSFSGGDGNDAVRVNGDYAVVSTGGGNDWISVAGDHADILAGDGDDHIRISGDYAFVVADKGNNDIIVNGKNATVRAGDGDDQIDITGADSIVFSGNGTNDVSIEADNVTLHGGKGDDTITIDGKNAVVWSGTGKDVFHVKDFNGTIKDFDFDNDEINLPLLFGKLNATQEGNSIVIKDKDGNTVVRLENNGSTDALKKAKKIVDSHNFHVGTAKDTEAFDKVWNNIQGILDGAAGIIERSKAKDALNGLGEELSKIADAELKYHVSLNDIKPNDYLQDSANIPPKIKRKFLEAIVDAYRDSSRENFEASEKGLLDFGWTTYGSIPQFDQKVYVIEGIEYTVSTIGSVYTGNAIATVSWEDENGVSHTGELEWNGEPNTSKFFNGLSSIDRDARRQIRDARIQILAACLTFPIKLMKGLATEDVSESRKILHEVFGDEFMKKRTKDEIIKIIDNLPGGKEIREEAKSLIEITQAVVS